MQKQSTPCLKILIVVLLLENFPGFAQPSPQTEANATASGPYVDPAVKEITGINQVDNSAVSPSSLPYSANQAPSPSYVNGVTANLSQDDLMLSNSLPPYSGAPQSPLKLAPAPNYQNRDDSSSPSPALSHDNSSSVDLSPSQPPYVNSLPLSPTLPPAQTKREYPSVSPPTSADIQEVVQVVDQPELENTTQQGPPMVNVDVDADPITMNHPSVLPFNYKVEDEMLEFHESEEDESWDGMSQEAVTGILVGLCVVGLGGFVYKVRMNKKRHQYQYQPLAKRSFSI